MTFRLTERAARTAALTTLLTLAVPALASAQATRTWVSGVGDDANPCSRTAPCKTFAGAISKTAAQGEIDVLDDGGFGAVTITKSITIDGGHHTAGVLVSGTNGVIINAAATDRVTLRNLDFNGVGTGLSAVKVIEARTVRVERSNIFGFVTAGIDVGVSTLGNHRIEVRDTMINGNAGPAIWDRPTGGATGKMTITGSALDDNAGGIFADATSGGRAKITATHNSIDDNATGTGVGVKASGVDATVRISDTSITGNVLGISALTGGQIQSFGNNVLTANETDGAMTGTIPLS